MLCAALLGLSCGAPHAGAERIVLIVIDTLRQDHVGAYGDAAETPNIDALAARGQVFPNVLAAFHQTTMSMGALFTGRTPSLETTDPQRTLRWNGDSWCGMARFATPGSDPACLPDGVPTLGERMSDAGYWTIGVPSNQFLFGDAGFSRGFDDWTEVGSPSRPVEHPASERARLTALRSWQPVTQAALAALARRQSDRFFLYVHLMDAHDYHYAKLEYRDAVTLADQAVGAIVDALAADGLLEGATILVTSDHGERFDERHRPPGMPKHYGNPSFQEVLQVPLVVAPPVREDASGLVRTQDLHGLLRTLAGDPAEAEGPPDTPELYVSERTFRSYQSGRWKSAIRRKDGKHFLYDLEADPAEQRNAAKQHPDIVQTHQQRVDELTRSLALERDRPGRDLSNEERRTLEALGYVE